MSAWRCGHYLPYVLWPADGRQVFFVFDAYDGFGGWSESPQASERAHSWLRFVPWGGALAMHAPPGGGEWELMLTDRPGRSTWRWFPEGWVRWHLAAGFGGA